MKTKYRFIIIMCLIFHINHMSSIPFSSNEQIQYSVSSSDMQEEIIFISHNKIDDEGLEYEFAYEKNRTPEEILQYQASLMRNNMDLLADPCEDFYQYACGNWEKRFPIPADKFEYNVFSLLNKNIFKSIRDLLSESPSISDQFNAEDKAKIFYQSCIDEKLLNKRGIEPLKYFINEYGGWPVLDKNWNENDFDWVNLTAYAAILGHSIILEAVIETDLKNSEIHTIYITEPELGLSNREDYLSDANSNHLEAYAKLIKHTIQLLGVDTKKAEIVAWEIVEFEKKLANITYDYRDRPNLSDFYKESTIEKLEKLTPKINWKKYLETMLEMPLDSNRSIVVFQSDYYTSIEELIENTAKSTIANYIQWRNVQNFIENLDDEFNKIVQDFNDALTGQKVLQPKWMECVRETNDHLGMAVGAMFVRNYFDEVSKKDVISITKEMQDIFRNFLKEIDWLDDETKKLAENKVNKTALAVGYPEFILSKDELNKYYADLNFEEGKYFENSVVLRLYKTKKNRQRLFKNVDKNEWPMHPAVVNAYFEQTKNRIVIPAGILHPPIYHRHFPRFLNYGAIGAVVGHELTHGFDDIGRSFDLNGNLKDWWSNDSVEAFHERVSCFVYQYNNFSMHGKSIHGTASKGENIADNGGIRQSYFAYKNWLEHNKDSNLQKNEIVPGLDLTSPQLFFLAFAQAWCGAIRPEAIENRLETDYHCPGKFRVLGTLSNFEEFAKEYQCPIGSKMNPLYRCKMW